MYNCFYWEKRSRPWLIIITLCSPSSHLTCPLTIASTDVVLLSPSGSFLGRRWRLMVVLLRPYSVVTGNTRQWKTVVPISTFKFNIHIIERIVLVVGGRQYALIMANTFNLHVFVLFLFYGYDVFCYEKKKKKLAVD